MATWLEKIANDNARPRMTEREMQDIETYFRNNLRRVGYKYKGNKPEDEIPARPRKKRLNKEEGFRNPEEPEPKKPEGDPYKDDQRPEKQQEPLMPWEWGDHESTQHTRRNPERTRYMKRKRGTRQETPERQQETTIVSGRKTWKLSFETVYHKKH